ncbi:glycerophosphodiester phosphodiesterase [Streptomyces sp. NPDC048603]|uniref:glycerophosphodiester phosphodiesterase n=1 Tax=Streptomyces sp. NPDC048603 TaxID=3365577 RepID=UPI00370FF675
MGIMRSLTAVGHRGDPYRFRENTLDSVRSAFARGADAVEVDVRLTRDGVPVLLHDASLARLWRADVLLGDLSVAQLRELTGGGVPTLREALLSGNAGRVMLDLPGASPEDVRKVVDEVRECGARDRTYYCAGPRTMLAVRAADPGAEIALTWTTLSPPRRVLLDAVRPAWLNYRFGLVGRELTDALHADGLKVSAWTADTRWSMRRLIAAGVDSVTTNRPSLLACVRARSGR